MISKRPNYYENYVDTLSEVLIEKYPEAKRENMSKVWSKTHELATYAVINKVSLIGIIGYEVAIINNKKSFFIPIKYSYLSGNIESHNEYVKNTKRYLKEKKIGFSTTLSESGTIFKLLK